MMVNSAHEGRLTHDILRQGTRKHSRHKKVCAPTDFATTSTMPQEPKFQRIRADNGAFKSRVLDVEGATEVRGPA